MEITSRNASELPPAMSADITRPTREQIQEREPLTPPQVRRPDAPVSAVQARDAATIAGEGDAAAKEVERARAEATEPRPARPAAAGARGDADLVDISPRARQLMEQALARLHADEPDAAQREQRVEALRSARERGDLATNERVALAAERMLAGE